MTNETVASASGVTRAGFIQGSLASLAFCASGGTLRPDPRVGRRGAPRLVLGVVADTHLRTSPVNGKAIDKAWKGTYFESALRYFRERNVHAVVHCGDFAHLGQVVELQAHADIWQRVFPSNRAQDGSEVERLFVTGNHEFCSHVGGGDGAFVRRLYPRKEQWDDAVLQVDTAQKWKRVWGEEYREVWHREVRGFHFFGWQYGASLAKMAALLDECIETHGLGKTDRPFFFIGHVPQWRPGELIEVLKRHGCRNSAAFYGHNHYSAANLNTFIYSTGWFTSVNVPCCAPWYGAVILHDEKVSSARIEGREGAQRPHSRQGLVVSLYDGAMVVERHEFGAGGRLGRDIALSVGRESGWRIGGAGRRPFSRDELKRAVGAPQFGKGAELEVS
ncbi:MAG: metallophosphoesterase [Kiritimatiellae bacterium]|nr:metallophosphoesterase [Kiritimatiellia bacterium]